jgi:hypothetical protein
MKPFMALACVLFAVNSVLADPYTAAIRQAQTVSANETAANQRLMKDPSESAPQPNNPNPPPNPALQATLQNIQSLRNDFTAIGNAATNNSPLDAAKKLLTNDLAIAAQGAKPLPASISKLTDDLATAIAGNEKLRAPQPKLAQFIHAIFNSAHLTAAQQQMIFDGVQKLLTDGGASPDEIANVVNDLKTIASETK